MAACRPAEVEPEHFDRIPTRFPTPDPTRRIEPPSPTQAEEQSQPLPTPIVPNAPGTIALNPDEIPSSLPIYLIHYKEIPENQQEALEWAADFGLPNVEVREDNDELTILLSLDQGGNYYEELTFIRTPYDKAIVYSSGIFWENFDGATPTPFLQQPETFSSETVSDIALSFVRKHNLLQEPVIAHEFPSINDTYTVHVAFAPAGFRLTGIGQEPGATIRIDSSGRVVEARIVPAGYVAITSADIQPLIEIYPGVVDFTAQNLYYYERAQSGGLALDPLRFQRLSVPYGSQDDRAELVYISPVGQADRLIPAWLITRPHVDSWDNYDEIYYAAVANLDAAQTVPSPTPLAQTGFAPDAYKIVSPLVIESKDGRIYTNAVVEGITHTVSLDARTGDLIAVFGLTGDLALDDGRNQLYVDKHPHGLTIIDTATAQFINDIQIPTAEYGHARPQADPTTGNVLLFRDQMLLIADPLSETWQQTIPITVDTVVCDETVPEPPRIEQTWFDHEARLLYPSLISYDCTSRVSYTVVVYDMNTMSEVARYNELDALSGLAVNGRFYGKSWFQMERAFQWAWQNGQPWLEQTERGEDMVSALSGFQADEKRGWLYEMTGNGLQILDRETMEVVQTLAPPVIGKLVGFDPVTDNLYFVADEDGRLIVWSAANIQN